MKVPDIMADGLELKERCHSSDDCKEQPQKPSSKQEGEIM